MKSRIKLKCRSGESPLQAIFYNLCHNRIQIINEIVNEIEMQDRRKLAAGENFYSLCHNHTNIINEIVKEIEKQDRRKLAAGEIFLQPLSQSHAYN